MSSSLSSRILTGQDRHTTTSFFFSSVRPFVRFVVLYYISMPAMMMMMMIMMDDPGVSFSSSFCSYIKTPFFILFGWLVVVEQSSPPLHFFFRKMSSTTNVILQTHRELPRPLVQGFHTLFSTTSGPPGNPVPCFSFRSSIDEWNERTNERTTPMCFSRVSCVYSNDRVAA